MGGWSELAQTLASCPHPLAGAADPKICCNWSTANFLSILRGPGDPSKQPWYGILLGYPVIGIWYWCCDQTIVQRVLAARDEKQARLGPLFCAFLKILPVFLFVAAGRDVRGAGAAGQPGLRRCGARRSRPTPTPS